MRNKRKRRQFIRPAEQSVTIDKGYYDDNGDLLASPDRVENSCAYHLTAEFPDHKVYMAIGKNLFVATGPSGIIEQLQKNAYEVPEKLKQWTGRAASAINAINKAVIARYKKEGTPIIMEYRLRRDLYLYTALDEEIEEHVNHVMEKCDEVMKDATFRIFTHFRHMARDAVAAFKSKGITTPQGGVIVDPTTHHGSTNGGSEATDS